MKVVMDFRKYDGVVGGVEQAVIQITRYVTVNGHQVIMLCKSNRFAEVKKIFEHEPNIITIPLPVRTHSLSLKNAWIDSTAIQNIAAKEGADIVHFPYNWSFPFHKKVPCILTIHDVIPFTFREAMGFFRNHLLYKSGTRQACRLNNVITTVSEFSKQEIVKKVGVPAEKIKVIPNGLREPAKPNDAIEKDLEKRFQLENGFILNVGGIHERKNLVRLIRAFSKLVAREGYSGKLLVTGSVSSNPYLIEMKKRCDTAVKEAGMETRVIFTGFIPDKELDSLLRHADLLVYPSLYEGFGMPIIEAMQAGTPVITSNIRGTAEVAGDAAILVDPYNIDEIASGMSRLLHDHKLRAELNRKGMKKASSYSWAKTSEKYLELYKELSESN
uniref:D-inositol-3-phosphate glycosyltransferase n=1 Tax=Candidatus Methanophagaceae archaeon ANME-1 ERB6 TaxID=2759912 RepID=A0A7G9YZ85_9EURY|nr:D-inositol-3-phosphate glycosyltransferase [Methanosarcinales archaeon ANME-1 ERB6]